jgi:hypothetical protein
MKKFAILAAIAVLCFATLASAQVPERFFDLPKFTAAPTLDGDRSSVANEWAGALEFNCSPSQILADGAEFGWRDIEQQASEVSANQLNENGETEQAGEGRTDADFASMIWQAWDDDALYYLTEVSDNVRDTEGGGEARAWWERDSMSLYLDMNNEDHPGGDPTGEYVNLNVVNFMAVPQNSSALSVCYITTVQNARVDVHDADAIEGFDYGFRDAGDEFGDSGEADYVIEGRMEFDTFVRNGNLFASPTVGSEMGFTWLPVDSDGESGYGGQLQCVAWAGGNQSEFANWVFVDTPAGPTDATAVEEDSWASIKQTFVQ